MGNWMKLGTHGQRDHHFIRNFGRFEAFEQGPLRWKRNRPIFRANLEWFRTPLRLPACCGPLQRHQPERQHAQALQAGQWIIQGDKGIFRHSQSQQVGGSKETILSDLQHVVRCISEKLASCLKTLSGWTRRLYPCVDISGFAWTSFSLSSFSSLKQPLYGYIHCTSSFSNARKNSSCWLYNPLALILNTPTNNGLKEIYTHLNHTIGVFFIGGWKASSHYILIIMW